MNITPSLFERIGAFNSADAAGRKRFARKYQRSIDAYRGKPAVGGTRTDSFDLTSDLRQQELQQPEGLGLVLVYGAWGWQAIGPIAVEALRNFEAFRDLADRAA